MRKTIYLCVALLLLVASFFAGRGGIGNPAESGVQYPLLARRIQIENPNDNFVNFSQLRSQIESYARENALVGSIYFEYLPTGTSIRIQGDSEQVAASLMKMPVIMDLYRAHELGRINLDDTVDLKEEWLDSRYGELYKKGAGYTISYRQAAELAMRDSDNTAYAAILFSTSKLLSLDENSIAALDVSFGRDDNKEILISARSYTSFVKCLYFSCFLNYEHSQEILGYLADAKFDNRLRAGVPGEVKVAHKIGTFSDKVQSDCGIVYLDRRNYALCVMLSTSNEQLGSKHIADLSEITYKFVSGIE